MKWRTLPPRLLMKWWISYWQAMGLWNVVNRSSLTIASNRLSTGFFHIPTSSSFSHCCSGPFYTQPWGFCKQMISFESVDRRNGREWWLLTEPKDFTSGVRGWIYNRNPYGNIYRWMCRLRRMAYTNTILKQNAPKLEWCSVQIFAAHLAGDEWSVRDLGSVLWMMKSTHAEEADYWRMKQEIIVPDTARIRKIQLAIFCESKGDVFPWYP